MHPRLSVNHACFRNTGVEEFIGLCRSIGARHIVLPGPHLLVDGPDAAIEALGSDGPTVEAIYHRFAIFPDLEADEGQAIEGLLGLIDIASKLRARSIYLVRVSDYVLGDRSVPARAVPGDGAVPLEPIIGDLLEAGYTGVFDIELLGPRIDAEGPLSAVTRAAERVEAILTRSGVSPDGSWRPSR